MTDRDRNIVRARFRPVRRSRHVTFPTRFASDKQPHRKFTGTLYFRDKHVLADKVLESVENDASLKPADRQAALRMARARGNPTATELYYASLEVVKLPGPTRRPTPWRCAGRKWPAS